MHGESRIKFNGVFLVIPFSAAELLCHVLKKCFARFESLTAVLINDETWDLSLADW
jgi:hypothetical protein